MSKTILKTQFSTKIGLFAIASMILILSLNQSYAEEGNTTVEVTIAGINKNVFYTISDPDGVASFVLAAPDSTTSFDGGCLTSEEYIDGFSILPFTLTVTDCQASPDVTVWEIDLTGAVTCIEGSCLVDDDDDVADHYLAYDVKETKHTDKFQKFTVRLDDQFESATYIVEKPDRLYNPVQKTHDGTTTEITDAESHYVGYKIKTPKGEPKFEKITNVLVQNQFGDITVDVKKPKLLLVPSLKAHDDFPVIVDPFTINHYKCYDVKETKGTDKFVKRIVSVFDPNFEKTNDFEVKKPKMLCTPVKKILDDGTTSKIIDEQNHLMCYDLKKMKGEPKFEKRNVFTNNQFGPEELEVKKEHQLCVPSIKTLP